MPIPAALRVGVVNDLRGTSSESSYDSDGNGGSDYSAYSPRQLRSSRSDDSDRERKPVKRKKLTLAGISQEEFPIPSDELSGISPLKRTKMIATEIKVEDSLMDPTFIPPPSSSSAYFSTPSSVSFASAIQKKKKKRIPYTLVEASKGNKCPTEGCSGMGHITGMYAMHFAVSGCPLAHGKTAEECKARRDELNRLRTKTAQEERERGEEPLGYVGGASDRPVRKSQRPVLLESSSSGPIGGSTPLPKKLASRVSSVKETIFILFFIIYLYRLENFDADNNINHNIIPIDNAIIWPLPFSRTPSPSAGAHHPASRPAGEL